MGCPFANAPGGLITHAAPTVAALSGCLLATLAPLIALTTGPLPAGGSAFQRRRLLSLFALRVLRAFAFVFAWDRCRDAFLDIAGSAGLCSHLRAWWVFAGYGAPLR